MNTKSLRIVTGLAVIMLLISACNVVPVFGSHNLITETRNVSGFDRVEISAGGDVEIIQDGTEGLTVETDDNVMQYIVSEVRGRTLYLGLEFMGFQSIIPTHLHFTLHVKNLTGIITSGSWDVLSESIGTSSLEIVISGSGKVQIDTLAADELTARISGSGEMDLAGEVVAQDITISGSGKYRAGDLRTETSHMFISGSGQATLWATQSLNVDISGSGHVEYYGSPQVSFHRSGSGDVQSLGEKQ